MDEFAEGLVRETIQWCYRLCKLGKEKERKTRSPRGLKSITEQGSRRGNHEGEFVPVKFGEEEVGERRPGEVGRVWQGDISCRGS